MTKELVNPNLHVILIHYPLALLTVGTVIELLAVFFWRRSGFRAAGRWMILIGILSLVPTVTSGLYAMWDVNRLPSTEQSPWAEVRASSPVQGHAWQMMKDHAWYNAAGSVVLLFLAVIWLGMSDAWRRRLHVLFLLLLVGSLSTLIVASWHGGEMIYRHGVGVETASAHDEDKANSHAAEEERDWRQIAAHYVPPMQAHVILAGTALSLALAALGLSMRRPVVRGDVSMEMPNEYSDIASAFNPTIRSRVPGSFDPQEEAAMLRQMTQRPPAGRFWVLAMLLALLAAGTGVWTLAHYSGIWHVKELVAMVRDHDTAGGYRRLVHVGTGVAIVLVLAVLAMVSQLRAGRGILLTLFSLVMLVAFAAQLWFGSLLMFDTQSGPLGRLNGTEVAAPLDESSPAPPATKHATTRSTGGPLTDAAR